MVETEVEDDDFLNQLAAAEAEALSAKRRKITTTTTTNSSPSSVSEEEGSYIAALKGSRSLLFQQQFSNTTTTSNTIPKPIGGSAAGSCFKCGKPGHWARDCESNANSYSSSVDSSFAAVVVAEKACPCGLGVCIVLTANTDKNRGRKFYKCPLREESGGCGFFEWCDKSSGTDNMNTRSQSYTINRSVPELSCPCGAGSCLTLTAKTGKNIGQQFYRCPASQESCGFFKWCNDHTTAITPAAISDSKVYQNSFNEMGNKNHGGGGGGGGGSCFKCGKDGHWSKDCSSVPSNTCFNCGKPGHWAKDCSSSSTASSTRESENRKSR